MILPNARVGGIHDLLGTDTVWAGAMISNGEQRKRDSYESEYPPDITIVLYLMGCSWGSVRVKRPDDLLIFRGYGAMRDVLEGIERRGRRVGIEVLMEGVGGDCLVIGAEEVLEQEVECVNILIRPLVD